MQLSEDRFALLSLFAVQVQLGHYFAGVLTVADLSGCSTETSTFTSVFRLIRLSRFMRIVRVARFLRGQDVDSFWHHVIVLVLSVPCPI